MVLRDKLNLNINPLVGLLTGFFTCGKNSVYKSKDIAYRLVQSAVHNQSLEAMFKLTKYLSADRMLDKLHGISRSDVEGLIKKCDSKLKLPKNVIAAIDFTEKEYYGDKSHAEVMGSKDGKYVRRYIEISIVDPPLFINAVPVNQLTNNKVHLLNGFLDGFREMYKKTSIQLLLLDRGFFTKDVVELLMDRRMPFIMPAIKDKAIKKLAEAYEKGEVKSRIKYQFGNTTINLLFLKIENEVLVYATNTRKSALQVHLLYNKRWQIETNFREQNKFTFKTKSKDFNIRYLAFALGGLLFNAWQSTRSETVYNMESYLFKQVLIEELLGLWQKHARRDVVKSVDYFLVT